MIQGWTFDNNCNGVTTVGLICKGTMTFFCLDRYLTNSIIREQAKKRKKRQKNNSRLPTYVENLYQELLAPDYNEIGRLNR